MWELSLFPQSASTVADDVDRLYFLLIILSVLFAVPVAGLITYFAIKYRRGSRADRSGAVETSLALETLWIGVPVVLALTIFGLGARLFTRIYTRPLEGMDVYVVGKQWMWHFEHPSGQREINELHVPVNQVVRLTMIAQDVIHSFYVPAFRLKRDVIPGAYTTLWFEATTTGSFHLFCAEYCGTRHSGMIGQIIVMEPRQYEDWLSQRPLDLANPIPEQSSTQGGEPLSMANAGAALFQSLGCASCHLMNGRGAAPALVGLYGSQVHLANGQTVTADADYIRQSILDPNAKIVAGYSPIMPTFAGQISEEELLRLVEYVRSLGNQPAGP